MLKIKEALLRYNSNLNNGETKMTQQRLASIVLPNKEIRNATGYINRLANGKSDHIKLSVLKKIIEVLKVDYNFILD